MKLRLLSPGFWFAVVLGAVCLWVLTLPAFPTQDGPMHRYYVHVLDALLRHQGTYGAYRVRHPFPPYASHYGALLLLFRVLPYDLAEKLFTCIVLLCLACGLRLSAREAGPAGRWFPLLCTPLLLSWPLMMGFFNFTLGTGLLLFCTGFWQRMQRSGVRSLVAFAIVLLLLTITHPLPLLLLIVLCGFDLILAFLFRPAQTAPAIWLREHRLQGVALLLSVMAAAFPALAIDASQTSSTMQLIHFHPEFLRTSLLLTGMSPYNSRSFNFWINAYRLCLYVLLAGAMWAGGRAALAALRGRRVNFGTTLFFATALLALALLFLPNEVNGSDYFSTRLVFLLWPASMLAASAGMAPTRRQQRKFIELSLLLCALTLIPAQLFLRPAANQVHAVEKQPLPPGVAGSLLLGDDLDEYERFQKQLAFDPLKWAGILPFVREDDVALDTPWLDLKILPLQAVPGGPELASDISLTRSGRTVAPLVPGRSLPGDRESEIVRNSSFVVLTATPQELSRGLQDQLSPEELARYRCSQAQDWYLVCISAAR